jgi:hypothetical protein
MAHYTQKMLQQALIDAMPTRLMIDHIPGTHRYCYKWLGIGEGGVADSYLNAIRDGFAELVYLYLKRTEGEGIPQERAGRASQEEQHATT